MCIIYLLGGNDRRRHCIGHFGRAKDRYPSDSSKDRKMEVFYVIFPLILKLENLLKHCRAEWENHTIKPDLIANNLYEAVSLIL